LRHLTLRFIYPGVKWERAQSASCKTDVGSREGIFLNTAASFYIRNSVHVKLNYQIARCDMKGNDTKMKQRLDRLYLFYNSREWVCPDPLQYLYDYPDPCEREIVGLVAASLAYGKVAQILKSVSRILKKIGPSPLGFLKSGTHDSLQETFRGFKHRFTTGQDIAAMLAGVKYVIERYGSLYACLLSQLDNSSETVLPALNLLVKDLRVATGGRPNSLLPLPEKGSACKRLNLFLRWMVRQDEVDPGGWTEVSPAKLIVPLDTHMHRISLFLGLTSRRQANLQTATEITRAFARMEPDDPVRYDFALTRLGIRRDCDINSLMDLAHPPVRIPGI
jgi:uncharacterized protein (TIGR02757 family)